MDIHELDKRIDVKLFESHNALSKSVSGFGSDLKKGLDEINKHTNQLDVMQYKIDSNNKISESGLLDINKKIENGLNDTNKKLEDGFKEINDKLQNFVTVDQFWPVKTLVYSAVGIILTSVIVAGISFIIVNSSNNTHATSQESK